MLAAILADMIPQAGFFPFLAVPRQSLYNPRPPKPAIPANSPASDPVVSHAGEFPFLLFSSPFFRAMF